MKEIGHHFQPRVDKKTKKYESKEERKVGANEALLVVVNL